MLKIPLRLAIVSAVLLSGLGIGVTLGAVIYAAHTSHAVPATPDKKAQLTTITMPRAQDLFEPFILPVPLHATVTWKNDDTVTHIFTTTPDKNIFLNPQSFSFTVAAG